MPKQTLVIVESPTKAKTIRKFLSKDFVIEASVGHVRDLPDSAADIPKDLKGEEWTKLGVNVAKDFEPLYVIPKGKSKTINELKRKLKEADRLILATDEDREGESISWHLVEVLKPKVPTHRMVFHEITKSAIDRALKETREIDMNLVRAQEARRVLDRLYGYTLSPLIWKKIAYGLSAGRVQSSALRMIVVRERERLRFRQAQYADIEVQLSSPQHAEFHAKSTQFGDRKIATGKDFDEWTGHLKNEGAVVQWSFADASSHAKSLSAASFVVESVEEKSFQTKPYAPFITSTLQQEANRKFGWPTRDTMRVAQSLYEQGFITYMRTDSPNLSQEAIRAARSAVEQLYGKEFLSAEVRQYSAKSKQAQEAHEAIRPAGQEFVHPKEAGIGGREGQLYELIWKRTVACQMAEARKLSVVAKLQSGQFTFQANGSRILFTGYLRAYVEGADDPDAALEDREVILPALKKGDVLTCNESKALPHETKPPARFTEASLVQSMEKEGIGRPSTYASVISTLLDRKYVKKQGTALVPSFTGFAVAQLLEKHFSHLVDLGFTAKMEQSLDEIASGDRESVPYLREFYSGKEGIERQVAEKDKKIDPEESRTVDLSSVQDAVIKIGRYGAYIVKPLAVLPGNEQKTVPEVALPDDTVEATSSSKTKKKRATKAPKKKPVDSNELHANIPEDCAPSDLNAERIDELLAIAARGPTPVGVDPKTNLSVYVLSGRFGPYVQLGEKKEDGEDPPRRASIPKTMDPKALTLDEALHLLVLPRDLGLHPESGLKLLVNVGRFGPYVQHGTEYRSLKKTDDVYTVGVDRVVEILKEPKRARGGAERVRELGAHPEDGKPVEIYAGKYGPYIKYKSKNASLPKDKTPETVTLEEAVELLSTKKATRKAG